MENLPKSLRKRGSNFKFLFLNRWLHLVLTGRIIMKFFSISLSIPNKNNCNYRLKEICRWNQLFPVIGILYFIHLNFLSKRFSLSVCLSISS
jgi:hypothetical protein